MKWDWLAARIKELGYDKIKDFAAAIGYADTRLSEMINGKIVNGGKIRNFPKDKEIIVAKTLKIPLANFKEYNEGITDEIVFDVIDNENNTIQIEMLDARACCGTGLENFNANIIGLWRMPLEEYRTITTADANNVKMLRVTGDSMEPTLSDGDWVLVDTSQHFVDRDGLFLIRMTSGLAVKRIQNTIGADIIIKSDNVKYNDITAPLVDVTIIGKVIYTLKAEKVG